MNWIEANGVALRYALSGCGDPLVVFLHEAGGSIESWDRLAERLAPRVRVLRYDQRGFGMSERARELSLPGMVADLCALLDGVGIDKPVHLVGTAIGGTVALATAALHPQRVASVIATSPVAGGLPDAAKSGLLQRAAVVEREGMRAIADMSLLRSYPPALRSHPAAFEQYRARYLANDPESFAALTRAFIDIDMPPMYERIRCRAMIVGCAYDVLKPPAECAHMASLLPHGRYAELQSGHFVSVQSPDMLADLIEPFIESTA